MYLTFFFDLFLKKKKKKKKKNAHVSRTAVAAMSTLAHHGIIYVPLGYKPAFASLSNLSEVHGGSPWGAGTFAGGDGTRQPTALELDVAEKQGEAFARTVAKYAA